MDIHKNITDLQAGEEAIISNFSDGYIAGKLMAMGLLPGTVISLIRKSPFGGAYYIKTNNHYVALRSNEAVEVVLLPSTISAALNVVKSKEPCEQDK